MKKPIHDDIPTDRAWQEGRRIYVVCGKKSTLNDHMRAIGARWDWEQHALWVGSTKKDKVIPIVLAAQARAKDRDQVKAAGRWVTVPRGEKDIRLLVERLKGVYDGERKAWAMRSDEDLARVQGMIRERKEDEAAARAARREAEQRIREQLRQQGVAEAELKERVERERILAESGRTPTGEVVELREISTQYMNRATAWKQAMDKGELVRLEDGRRGVVVAVDVWFTPEEIASSICWHRETHDEAHWDFDYKVAVVEPTPEEVADDAAAAARRADAEAIHALIREASRLTQARAEDRWTHIPEEDIVGQITGRAGRSVDTGRLTLTRDGRVIWQHPGHYDDYIRSEGVSCDPGLVERVRGLFALGSRERTVRGQLTTCYTVTVRS